MTISNIAAAINAAHAGVEAAKREGSKHAVECGRLLHEAKETVEHGGWDGWIRNHCSFSPRTAQLYMRIYQHVKSDPAKAQRVADLSVRELDRQSRRPKPTPAVAPVKLAPAAQEQFGELFGAWMNSNTPTRIEFARYLLNRGDITDDQFDSMACAAERSKTVTKEQARRRLAESICKMEIDEQELKLFLKHLSQSDCGSGLYAEVNRLRAIRMAG